MSEPIQSISNGNYILHNIDAKKLYVQEPLFTANSGDAVYVGWRPDETVLWSGSGVRLSAETQLSESMANFEKVEFWWGGLPNSQTQYYTIDTVWSPCIFYAFTHGAGGNNCWQQWGRLSSNSDNYDKVIMDKGKSFNYGAATSTSWANPTVSTGIPDSFFCYKIVGVNRKENA